MPIGATATGLHIEARANGNEVTTWKDLFSPTTELPPTAHTRKRAFQASTYAHGSAQDVSAHVKGGFLLFIRTNLRLVPVFPLGITWLMPNATDISPGIHCAESVRRYLHLGRLREAVPSHGSGGKGQVRSLIQCGKSSWGYDRGSGGGAAIGRLGRLFLDTKGAKYGRCTLTNFGGHSDGRELGDHGESWAQQKNGQ
jgi:hypothetical protein